MPGLRRCAAMLAAFVVGAALLSVPTSPASAAPKAHTLKASDTHPVRGEKVRLTVDLPGKFRRPVRLQRKSGKRWVTIAKKRSNRRVAARFSYRMPARMTRLRAVAPAVRHAGRRHAARRSRVLVLRPRQQSARLVMPTAATPGERIRSIAVFVPARKGRRVVLQRRDGKVWRQIATTRQNRYGQAAVAITARAGTYRVLARAHRGAPAVASRTVSMTVTTPVKPPASAPDPDPDPDPAATVGRVDIVTDDGLDVTSKEDYSHATMTVTSVDGTAQVLPTRLRVRGNSTSWVTMKRPYKVKLDTSASVLGLPKSKDWVLLANFYDRSLLRNDVALELARRLEMPWVPRMRPVELWLNDKYYGLYQLGEGIEVQDGRVELEDEALLLEADRYDDDDPWFVTSRGLRIFVKSSEEESDRERASLRVQEAENAIYGSDFADPSAGYAAHLDVGSFVDWYLLTEITKNYDSAFKNSVWMVLGGDDRVRIGPPWDFDLSMGNRWSWDLASPEGWFIRRNFFDLGPDMIPSQMMGPEGHWLVRLFEDPAFEATVAARWREIRDSLTTLPDYVADSAATISDAAQRTFTPRPDGGAGIPLGATLLEDARFDVFHGSWAAEAAALEDWLAARIAWLDTQYG